MSWLNLNDSLNSIKGQISTFANNVLADENTENCITSEEFQALKQLCSSQNEEIKQLRLLQEKLSQGKVINDGVEQSDASWDWDSSPRLESKTEDLSNLKQKITELENDKKELLLNLELLDSDFQQNTEKLAQQKSQLQIQFNELEERFTQLEEKNVKLLAERTKDRNELEKLKSGSTQSEACLKCEDLLKNNQNCQVEIERLMQEVALLTSNNLALSKTVGEINSSATDESAMKLVESENKILIAELAKANQLLKEYSTKIKADSENARKLAFILEGYEQQVSNLKQELLEKGQDETANSNLEVLENTLKKLQEEKEQTHKKYIVILTENVKKYADCEPTSDFVTCSNQEDPQICEFNNQVESILNLLWDLKSKNQRLEKDLYNVTQEKTNLLTEKNYEIEKLLHNSEILSQEVITKSQMIKDYECECQELIKNNDLMINELEEYKNSSNSGLQTISESNEDNLLLLESQLDTANKRIEQLEDLITKSDNASMSDPNEKLEEKYKQLEQDYKQIVEENNGVLLAYEKLKTDLENTEYQYTEINVIMETMKDEIEIQRKKVQELVSENIGLKKINLEFERNSEDIRSELNLLREKLMLAEDDGKHLKNKVNKLEEKLQNAKMHETTLKLQFDTTNKELTTINGSKNSLEVSLKNALDTLSQCEEKFKKMKEENDVLTRISEDYKMKLDLLEAKEVEFEEVRFENLENTSTIENCNELEKLQIDFDELSQETATNSSVNQNLKQQLLELAEERDQLKLQLSELVPLKESLPNLQKQIQNLIATNAELTNVVSTKHQENVTYYSELQRLGALLNTQLEKNRLLEDQTEETRKQNENLEKLTDQNEFLRKKCEVLASNLLDEQNRLQKVLSERALPTEKEQSLEKKLERLQNHLIEVEEHYTQELLRSEEKSSELLAKVTEIEQREKTSSTMYTSVSIRANQHVETLQNQLQLITTQRDELRRRISDAEDHAGKQAAALANLQFVLDQFQKDKENDVLKETERIRRQIGAEKAVQSELRAEIKELRGQVDESKQGLLAATRLSDQLEHSKQFIITLKSEVGQLKEKLEKNEINLRQISSQTDGKVDKALIKNLIIGFVTTYNNLNKDQKQILKIIASVLDFNQQDHDRLILNQTQGWLSSFLAPQNQQGMSQESLSQAFVKFLETESKPRLVPSLLKNNEEASVVPSRKSSTASSVESAPIVLSEIVLPTFADFAQSRSSSSILKDVLKDNSNS